MWWRQWKIWHEEETCAQRWYFTESWSLSSSWWDQEAPGQEISSRLASSDRPAVPLHPDYIISPRWETNISPQRLIMYGAPESSVLNKYTMQSWVIACIYVVNGVMFNWTCHLWYMWVSRLPPHITIILFHICQFYSLDFTFFRFDFPSNVIVIW